MGAGMELFQYGLAVAEDRRVKFPCYSGSMRRLPCLLLIALAWWREGRIRPRIDRTYQLAEGGDAIAHLASRSAIGKVVVQVTQGATE